MQCHYHWLRLTLEILAALHVPGDSEIWIWGLQLKLLSSGEAQKITRMCLGPVSSYQTLSPYSPSLCRARGLPNPCGRPGTFTVSKQVVVLIIRGFWLVCPLQHGSWLIPGSAALTKVLGVSAFLLCLWTSLLTKAGAEGAVLVEVSSLDIPGMLQGFMCWNAWSSLVRPNSL